MKEKSSNQKTPQHGSQDSQQTSAAGPDGAVVTPPIYGLDVLDKPVSSPIIQGKTAPSASGDSPGGHPVGNRTGLPDALKTGIESLSNMSLDDVRVHTNSPRPAQLNALAYAQGTDIHVAPGQERHLPHEAWHVVQQKQVRVKPTMQMKQGVSINDDDGLEHEADVMGAKATQFKMGSHTESCGCPSCTQMQKSHLQTKEIWSTQNVAQLMPCPICGIDGHAKRNCPEKNIYRVGRLESKATTPPPAAVADTVTPTPALAPRPTGEDGALAKRPKTKRGKGFKGVKAPNTMFFGGGGGNAPTTAATVKTWSPSTSAALAAASAPKPKVVAATRSVEKKATSVGPVAGDAAAARATLSPYAAATSTAAAPPPTAAPKPKAVAATKSHEEKKDTPDAAASAKKDAKKQRRQQERERNRYHQVPSHSPGQKDRADRTAAKVASVSVFLGARPDVAYWLAIKPTDGTRDVHGRGSADAHDNEQKAREYLSAEGFDVAKAITNLEQAISKRDAEDKRAGSERGHAGWKAILRAALAQLKV